METQKTTKAKPGRKKLDLAAEVARVLELEGRAILECAKRIEKLDIARDVSHAIEILASALDQGGKIVVTGVGKSGKVGQKIASTLCSTGSLAVFLHPSDGMHGDLGLVTAKDAVLALSYSGNTEELVQLLPSLKKLGVPVVGLGGKADSKLAQSCDSWMDGSVAQEACPHNLAPTTSTTLALALGDALSIALMQMRGFDAGSFAKNHPGGTLGRKLNLRVSDVMLRARQIAKVSESTLMEVVVVALTEKRQGAVLVVKGEKLLGIITDGDLKRALKFREKFFSTRASEVMTKKPITCTEEMMAHEALKLMEDRPNQISVLPVVDSRGSWKGLVRLHDLIGSF
ncbi:MAG: KpsF/GutQ family sugar-phosphate isomerase [Bdellovibrionota bacterium]